MAKFSDQMTLPIPLFECKKYLAEVELPNYEIKVRPISDGATLHYEFTIEFYKFAPKTARTRYSLIYVFGTLYGDRQHTEVKWQVHWFGSGSWLFYLYYIIGLLILFVIMGISIRYILFTPITMVPLIVISLKILYTFGEYFSGFPKKIMSITEMVFEKVKLQHAANQNDQLT